MKNILKYIYALYLTVLIVFSFLTINNSILENEKRSYQRDLLSLAKITAMVVDKDAISYLINNINTISTIEELEEKAEYIRVKKQLLEVNEIYGYTSDYSYIFYPSNDDDIVYMIVSSDSEDSIEYNISEYPEMVTTNTKRIPAVGDISHDPQSGDDIWSMTACAPLYNGDVYLGSVGIDMLLENYNNNIFYAKVYALMFTISVILIGGILIPYLIINLIDYISTGQLKHNIKIFKTRRAIAKAKRESKI